MSASNSETSSCTAAHGRRIARATRIMAVGLAAAVVMTGCAAFDSAMAMATGDFDMDRFSAEMQVNMILPIALYGYGGDPQHGYEEGVGTVWEQRDAQSGESFRTERALLRNNPDGTQWWYISVGDGDEISEFEMLVDRDFAAREVLWRDPDTGEIQRITYDEPVRPEDVDEDSDDYEELEQTADIASFADDPPEGFRVTSERQEVTVTAGTFMAEWTRLEPDDAPDEVYETWLSDDVPGRLVRQRWVDGTEEWSGELIRVGDDYRTRFGAY